MSLRDHTESRVPLLRDNPHRWKRASNPLVLIRCSDVSKQVERVMFLTTEMREAFLVLLREKKKNTEGMSKTEIQREKLRKGTAGW